MPTQEENVIELETAARAAAQLHAVLRLAESGRLKCSQKTQRPSAATV